MAGFYRGCATNLMRTTPAAVITFTSFEIILRHLQATFPPKRSEAPSEPPVSSSSGSQGGDDLAFKSARGPPTLNSLSLTQKDTWKAGRGVT